MKVAPIPLALAWTLTACGMATAQNAPVVAAPYYSAEQAMQGLYTHHLPPLAKAFQSEADRLVSAADQLCQGQATLSALRAQWQTTLERWEALSTPAVGPLVTRRSQRQIDFWPTRPDLLRRSMEKAPATLADMERVGTPAKGFPALDLLLQQWSRKAPTPDACRYGGLIARGIAAEARALQNELGPWATKAWEDEPEVTTASLAEWVNQWLAGLERLRWAHIEKPITTHQTTGNAAKGTPVPYARLDRESNLRDWRAQWQSLRTQGRLPPGAPPPPAGQALVPMEALLMGRGHLALAQKWGQALGQVNAGMEKLTPRSSERELLALAKSMKAVTVLFQNEVAAALDVPLGFSDADGD
ncbi:imelysin family protein [Hydrogenophaga sp. BPS33]|uniref:imelysin family protein n=1 Tax=Hydrogenophaga sp. BPS33 TaxID=2651974 RepID=UPI00131F9EB1|nr:imelysin family protein [Hydrogenophaga sp. BPS33]QHE88643.1 imelysin family protein [Hydrogenophaga sp. BPS33]